VRDSAGVGCICWAVITIVVMPGGREPVATVK
jgi:hypothetical protein